MTIGEMLDASKEEGIKQGKIQMVKCMLQKKDKYSLEEIAELTSFDVKEIEAIALDVTVE